MKRLVVGLLAHVDSGKTTLAEGLLYRAGVLRKLGRVDHRDVFLDTDSQERARGITIFAKQAVLTLPAADGADETELTLLDTHQASLLAGRYRCHIRHRATAGAISCNIYYAACKKANCARAGLPAGIRFIAARYFGFKF